MAGPGRPRKPVNPALSDTPVGSVNQEFDADSFEGDPEDTELVAAPRRNETRSPLNHATASTSENIGGIEFKRSRSGFDHSSKMVLDINPKLLNNELEYRFVNDTNGRIDKLRETGYEVVDKLGDGSSTRRRVGANKDGSDLFAQLMATPKKWYAERQSKADESRVQKERGMLSGKTDGKDALEPGFYDKGSKIQR